VFPGIRLTVRGATLTKKISLLAGGGKRSSGPSSRPTGKVFASLLLPREFSSANFICLKIFWQGGTSQLLCVSWLFAWNVVSSEAGPGSSTCLQSGHFGMCSGGPSVLYLKQPLVVWPPPCPTDHLVYSDGLSPLTSVQKDKRKLIAPFANSSAPDARVRACLLSGIDKSSKSIDYM